MTLFDVFDKDFEKNIVFSNISINSFSISHHLFIFCLLLHFKSLRISQKKRFLFDFASGHTMKIHRSKVKRKQNPTPQVICSLGFWPGKKLLQYFLVGGWTNPFEKNMRSSNCNHISPQLFLKKHIWNHQLEFFEWKEVESLVESWSFIPFGCWKKTEKIISSFGQVTWCFFPLCVFFRMTFSKFNFQLA